jgi:hypothetical protein
MWVRISRPWPSTPSTRGAYRKPWVCRCRSSACTAGVHQPVGRYTRSRPGRPGGLTCRRAAGRSHRQVRSRWQCGSGWYLVSARLGWGRAADGDGSPPRCGTTTARTAPNASASRRRAVRHRHAPSRGRPPARRLSPGRERLACPLADRRRRRPASRGPTGPAPRLSDRQLAGVEQVLLEGATANGFVGELWTLDRIATVIERLTGVRHHPAHLWALLHHRLGWTVQRPVRQASERDQGAIDLELPRSGGHMNA